MSSKSTRTRSSGGELAGRLLTLRAGDKAGSADGLIVSILRLITAARVAESRCAVRATHKYDIYLRRCFLNHEAERLQRGGLFLSHMSHAGANTHFEAPHTLEDLMKMESGSGPSGKGRESAVCQTCGMLNAECESVASDDDSWTSVHTQT